MNEETFQPGDTVLIDGKIPGGVIRQEHQYVTVQSFGGNGAEITIDVINGRQSIEVHVCPFCGCRTLSALFFFGTFQGFVCENPRCKRLSNPNGELTGVTVI